VLAYILMMYVNDPLRAVLHLGDGPAVSERATDDLLEGLAFRDFIVLYAYVAGISPTSPSVLVRLRRTPLYVRRASGRLVERGLLARDGARLVVTADGARAARTGAAIFELDAFEA
jgi:hypothetical protein